MKLRLYDEISYLQDVRMYIYIYLSLYHIHNVIAAEPFDHAHVAGCAMRTNTKLDWEFSCYLANYDYYISRNSDVYYCILYKL